MNRKNLILFVAIGALLFIAGRFSVGQGEEGMPAHDHEAAMGEMGEVETTTLWTCPMHPQIKLPEFGDCPICGMDLVEMTTSGDDHPRQYAMSPAAKELARIETVPVQRSYLTRPVPMVGKIAFDETAMRTISAWVPGRLDRLFVDYTGVRVAKGDHLVRLYSPELLSAQEELLAAKDRIENTAGESSEFLAESNQRAYESAHDKLLLWGLTAEQVQELEARGTADDHVMLTSPASGVVIEKKLEEGAYVQTGTSIYKIADLDHLWVQLDAYEQDLPWLRYGQEVVVQAEALPGMSFEGRISFIDPIIHEHTRTAKVRVNIDNESGRLKPGMFVRAIAAARVGAEGAVLDQHLSGKWVSPMHPEVVKDGPGSCDVCGMDLVPAEELGLVGKGADEVERPLVVPASAVLVTGRRAVVYVEVSGAERPTYEGRVVVLGARAGDKYIIQSGLKEGEIVVMNGAFRIDSAMQILAKPSMMSMPAEEVVGDSPELQSFRVALTPLYDSYLNLHMKLAADDDSGARAAAKALQAAVAAVDSALLSAEKRATWKEERTSIEGALGEIGDAGEIEVLRVAYQKLAGAALRLQREFGQASGEMLREAYCSMAFDFEGASWLQAGEELLNPYFGDEMLRCGEFREEFPSEGESPAEVDGKPAAEPAESGEHEGHGH